MYNVHYTMYIVQCIHYTGYAYIVCYVWRVYCIHSTSLIYSLSETENHKTYRDDRPLV